jgi:hypothetical protein
MDHYLSACMSYRDEAPYLREWVEFHLLVGIEKFFLFDNRSQDKETAFAALAPYVDEGTVVLQDWDKASSQVGAFQRCLRQLLRPDTDETRWLAFLDADEFLFSPTGRPLPEVLADYEQWAAVGVNRATFGTSGHRTQPPGLVIESYVRRSPEQVSIKSIVDPRRADVALNPHAFSYPDGGFAVDEHGKRIEGLFTESFTFSRLRINHYWTKSEEEWRRRLIKPSRSRFADREGEMMELCDQVQDETIMSYVPALKKALAAREATERARRT